MSRILLAFLVLILAACAPGGQAAPADELPTQVPSRTPGGPTLTPVLFIPPESTPAQVSELLRFEGEGPGQGGPIRLDAETTLRIHWQQFDEQVFQVFVVNTDPNQSDPRYKKVSVALSAVPSIGYTDYFLVPGEYLLMVETAAGKWTIWVESIRP